MSAQAQERERPNAEQSDPLCLPREEALERLRDAPWRRFAVVGDSLSLGTGDTAPGYGSGGWSDRVAELLRAASPREFAYLNTARIGATTAETIEEQVPEMLAFEPDLLYLPCGANDLMARAPDFDAIEATLRELYGQAKPTGALLLTFTFGRAFEVHAFTDWAERIRRMNAITRAVAAEHGALVVDMWDHPVNHRPGLVSADGIHFSTMGQAVMASEVVAALGLRAAGTR